MSDSPVLIQIDRGIATLTLNRADVHNAFDEHMIAALDRALIDLSARGDVIALVLRGAGASFCAGADLEWMRRAATFTEDQNRDDALALARMLHRLYTMPMTTIAAVQGVAFGGGLGLVACCDIVLAQVNAKFALSEVRLGLIPATIAPYVLRAVGARQMRRYAQTGERFDAKTAQVIGLAHDVVDDVDVALPTVLSNLRANGPAAMRAAKILCADLDGRAIDDALITDTATRIAQTRAGDEAKEGLSAFLEKRKAGWVS